MANDRMVIEFSTTIVKSRPCENSLADFCTSALLKALKIGQILNLIFNTVREFSNGLSLKFYILFNF